MSKKLTNLEFIEKSNKRHNSRYDYSKSYYVNNNTKVEIICNIHGSFIQQANSHMRGAGCPQCNGGIKYTKSDFIIESTKIHDDLYDYSVTNYSNSCSKVDIVCKKHGIFSQLANNHLRGQGCPKCVGKFLSNDEFIIAILNICNNE